jgi:hypothetical protein
LTNIIQSGQQEATMKWNCAWSRHRSAHWPQHRATALRCRPALERLEERELPTIVPASFTGIDFSNSGGTEPPDSDVAAGPAYLVETVNISLAIYNKSTGAQVSIQGLDAFFAPAGAGPAADMFDPTVTYDDIAGRFVVSVLEENDTAKTSFLDVAVSNDSDPTHGFTEMHHINTLETAGGKSLWADYPKVGWNADAYVYAVNMYSFPNATGTFDHVQLITLDKSSLLDANNSTFTDYLVDRTDPADFVMAAASMHGATAGMPMWFVDEGNGSSDLRVIQMTNVLSSTPTFNVFTVTVPAYGAIVDPTQPNGQKITTIIDTTILNTAFRGNTLVASQNVGASGVTHGRWYEFDVSSTPTLIQSGDIDRGAGVNTYFPAVDIAPDGGLGMSFLESSSTEFMSMYVASRSVNEPAGTLEPPVLVQAGQANYNSSRAGDFSGISVDPLDGSFWAANEFANQEATNWGTWIAHFHPSPIILATGVDAGAAPQVSLFDGYNGGAMNTINAYDPSFQSGVRVAVGDVNGDGVPDIVTAPGPGNQSLIRVFDSRTGSLLHDFMAYSPYWLGGAFVAVGDVNGDGYADIITGADQGGGPEVKVYSGKDNSILYDFYAYGPYFTGGVRVAAGDIDGDGKADIITGAGPSGGPHVQVFSGATGAVLMSFMAYSQYFQGGVYVAAADVNHDGKADVITGAGAGGGPHVEAWSGADGSLLRSFMAFSTSFSGGVRVAGLSDVNADSQQEIVVGSGPGAPSQVKILDGATVTVLDDFNAYGTDFMAGIFVGGE